MRCSAFDNRFKKVNIVHEISGVATSTLNNWLHGDTENPQHAAVAAFARFSQGVREEITTLTSRRSTR
jgi:hypothetical protein